MGGRIYRPAPAAGAQATSSSSSSREGRRARPPSARAPEVHHALHEPGPSEHLLGEGQAVADLETRPEYVGIAHHRRRQGRGQLGVGTCGRRRGGPGSQGVDLRETAPVEGDGVSVPGRELLVGRAVPREREPAGVVGLLPEGVAQARDVGEAERDTPAQ
jgi:hypothetical protein